MNKSLSSVTLMLLSGLSFTGSTYAASTPATLDITALVGAVCSVSTTPVIFNNVSPTFGATTTGGVSVTCSAGMPYTIALDAGQHFNGLWRAVSDGMNTMEYGLYDPASAIEWGDGGVTYSYGTTVSGTGTGTNTSYVINASLFPATVPEGVYSDVVKVSVNY